MTTECPFYPGKKCYGTCSNHNSNVQEVFDESIEKRVTTSAVEAWMRVDTMRFVNAKLKSIIGDGFFEECDNNPQN